VCPRKKASVLQGERRMAFPRVTRSNPPTYQAIPFYAH
jgi:hypothetical protein